MKTLFICHAAITPGWIKPLFYQTHRLKETNSAVQMQIELQLSNPLNWHCSILSLKVNCALLNHWNQIKCKSFSFAVCICLLSTYQMRKATKSIHTHTEPRRRSCQLLLQGLGFVWSFWNNIPIYTFNYVTISPTAQYLIGFSHDEIMLSAKSQQESWLFSFRARGEVNSEMTSRSELGLPTPSLPNSANNVTPQLM